MLAAAADMVADLPGIYTSAERSRGNLDCIGASHSGR